MKAEDTVITSVDKAIEDLEAHNLPSMFSYRQAYFAGAEAQVEITFREGIEEVTECLNRMIERAFLKALAALPMYDDDAEWANNSANVLRNAWQAKRKELGIE